MINFNKVFSDANESITIQKDGSFLIFSKSKIKLNKRKILCVDQYGNVWKLKYPGAKSKQYKLIPYNPNTKTKHYHFIGKQTIDDIILKKHEIEFFKNINKKEVIK